ncbi:MAG: hypothetical protein WAM08_13645, partial [Candidatus Acidiferrales bacterium]
MKALRAERLGADFAGRKARLTEVRQKRLAGCNARFAAMADEAVDGRTGVASGGPAGAGWLMTPLG